MQEFNVRLISEGFWMIEDSGVRSFLVEGSKKSMLVDTCFGNGDIKELAEKLTDKPLIVVNTHTDMDHIGGNDLFEAIYMHPLEIENYKNKNENLKIIPIVESDIIDLGNKVFEVIEAPGHTLGSIMFFSKQDEMIISGDSIGLAPIFMFGEHRDLSKYISSLKKINSLNDKITTIWPSHGECPVQPSLIEVLIQGANQLKDGKLYGTKPPNDFPCKLYEYKNVKFLY